jgi:hypothetical protein
MVYQLTHLVDNHKGKRKLSILEKGEISANKKSEFTEMIKILSERYIYIIILIIGV